jgi:hypothetical protein
MPNMEPARWMWAEGKSCVAVFKARARGLQWPSTFRRLALGPHPSPRLPRPRTLLGQEPSYFAHQLIESLRLTFLPAHGARYRCNLALFAQGVRSRSRSRSCRVRQLLGQPTSPFRCVFLLPKEFRRLTKYSPSVLSLPAEIRSQRPSRRSPERARDKPPDSH